MFKWPSQSSDQNPWQVLKWRLRHLKHLSTNANDIFQLFSIYYFFFIYIRPLHNYAQNIINVKWDVLHACHDLPWMIIIGVFFVTGLWFPAFQAGFGVPWLRSKTASLPFLLLMSSKVLKILLFPLMLYCYKCELHIFLFCLFFYRRQHV